METENIKILTPEFDNEYELLDSGNNSKLEKFGNKIIVRSDTNCVWNQNQPEKLWQKIDILFQNQNWLYKKNQENSWPFEYKVPQKLGLCKNKLIFQLKTIQSKNIGIFPEQASNWLWMMETIIKSKKQPNILNLFAYTGISTICAASVGAQVCHVDASKPMITWGKQNQILCKIEDASIRWIIDDCAKFVTREVNRGKKYDALIMDPPAFGRDPKGKIFEFEKNIYKLLTLCKQILTNKPLFVIFNGYSAGYSATVLKNLLFDFFPEQKNIEFGELQLKEKFTSRTLPCSLYARFRNI